MFLLRSHPTPGPTLNAIASIADTHAQRHTRRLGLCARLAELGMDLAEATHREMLHGLQPRPTHYTPKMPGLLHAPTLPCPPTTRDTSLTEPFATFSRCVRQAVLLEARLDTGTFDHPLPAITAPAEPAPKKSAPSPAREPGDGTSLEYERLEDDLAAEARRPADEILLDICEQLGQALERPNAPSLARPADRRTQNHGAPPPEPNPRPDRVAARRPPKPG